MKPEVLMVIFNETYKLPSTYMILSKERSILLDPLGWTFFSSWVRMTVPEYLNPQVPYEKR